MAGARSLAELQLRIYWHKGMWMKCKIRLKLSQLGCSWGLTEPDNDNNTEKDDNIDKNDNTEKYDGNDDVQEYWRDCW